MTDFEDRKSVTALLRRYQKVKPELDRRAAGLCRRISALSRRIDLNPMIVSRVPELEAFADLAAERRGDPKPLDAADLCLVEVAVHTRDQVPMLVRVLENELELDDEADITLVGGHEASRRFTVRLENGLAELQIRTLIGHAWASIHRDLGRRNERCLPQVWRRELAEIDARLQDSDWALENISETIGTYGSAYAAYLDPTRLATLATRLEAVLDADPANTGAAARLIRAYAALDDDDIRVQEVFAAHKGRLRGLAATLCDVGAAACRSHQPDSPAFRGGRRHLEKACRLDPSNVLARCELGRSFRIEGSRDAATDCFADACSLDPTHPRALRNRILEAIVASGDSESIDDFRPMMPLAADRARAQADTGVNLPWAFFDLGFFHLLDEHGPAALGAFAGGLQFATRGWMVQQVGDMITEIQDLDIDLPEIAAVRWLLDLGIWARSAQSSRNTLPWSPPRSTQRFRKKIVVLTGSGSWGGDLDSPLVVLKSALDGYRGTLVAPGTRDGVGGVAGDLAERLGAKKLRTMAYLRADREADARYADIRTVAADAPLGAEALSFWQSLLASGFDATAVRLISVGGDVRSRAEIQIALAFGARVGILEGGEGEAGEQFWEDARAQNHQNRVERLELCDDAIVDFVEDK